MAHFYGTIEGSRGEASRLGTKNSGFEAVAASWEGCVKVRLYHSNGMDMARVTLDKWRGQGTERLLYDGPVSGAWVPEMATEEA